MFSKLFYTKAIGFKFSGDSIQYAFITLSNNKIVVNETQIFKLNCKAALQRLQHLLVQYPSVYIISSSEALLKAGPEDVTSPKDRKQIVKNKIESLIENKKTALNLQDYLKKGVAPFFIIQKEILIHHENILQKYGLKPQKIVLSAQAYLSLENHFCSFLPKKVLCYFMEDEVEVLFMNKKKLTFFNSFKIKNLLVEDIVKKILRLLYAQFNSLEDIEFHFHGANVDFEKILESFHNETGFNVKIRGYSSLEEKAPNFLVEVGAALSMIKQEFGGFQKERWANLIKVYKKALIANATLIIALFVVSYFYWSQKFSYIQNQNQILFEKSYAELKNEKLKIPVYSCEHFADLNNLLITKKKEVLNYLFEPNTLLVSDTLAWLSDIAEELKTNESTTPFVIETFKYNLFSRPTLKKPKTPYRVKVTFSFSTDSSLTARLIHERISNSKEVVDKGKKISWNYQNNRYQISFYLKNDILKKATDA